MIHYQLRCTNAHEFDGWFASSSAFDSQAERQLVECPHCGSSEVARALMAPAVASGAAEPALRPVEKTDETVPSSPAVAAGGPMPAHLMAMFQRIRAEVEKNCDHVGPEFANEARRIHRGEADARGIYGETTSEEAEALADEGIEVARIPWVPRADG